MNEPMPEAWGSTRSSATLSELGLVVHYGMIRDEKIRQLMLERVLSLIAREECRLEQLKYDQPDEFDKLFQRATEDIFVKTFY